MPDATHCMKHTATAAGKEVLITGRIVKTARLRAEYYEIIDDLEAFFRELKTAGVQADLFTFLQGAADPVPHFNYHLERDSISVLPITTFDHWWKQQIKDKVRNMARRAKKKGVEVRVVPFDDNLVRGIMEIYNESPVRQGRRFWHYGKDFETTKRDHITFLDRSEFIGAFLGGELIGFIKLVHGRNVSNCMQIIAKIAHRDKAAIDALLTKAVEICAQKNVPNLHYGIWSRGGLGEYKVHRGFQRVDVPRYYVPLTLKGRLLLKLRLHRPLSAYLPEKLVEAMVTWRGRWYSQRYHEKAATG